VLFSARAFITFPGMAALIIATQNTHKVDEIRAILGGPWQYSTLAQLPDAPRTVEDANTFSGNATKKAVELAQWLASTQQSAPGSGKCIVLADDSGLEVDALNGEPGVHSARFAAMDSKAAGNSPDPDNNSKLLRLLRAVPLERRSARFRCVIALVQVTPKSEILNPHLFEGACEGRIGFEARGQGGFGYDPLFTPTGFEKTFAELGEEIKNKLSHRARALEQAGAWLQKLKG
jgi:XTP/dITP diphosphohydrolase